MDYHWRDLFKLLSPGSDPETFTERERRKLMHDNPDIVAYFFTKRCEIFMETVLKSIFGVEDSWFHNEWQWRGSFFSLLWLKDAPSIKDGYKIRYAH